MSIFFEYFPPFFSWKTVYSVRLDISQLFSSGQAVSTFPSVICQANRIPSLYYILYIRFVLFHIYYTRTISLFCLFRLCVFPFVDRDTRCIKNWAFLMQNPKRFLNVFVCLSSFIKIIFERSRFLSYLWILFYSSLFVHKYI